MVKTSPSSAGGMSSTPGRELRFHMTHSQKNKTFKKKSQKQYCNKFNKYFFKLSTSKKSFKKIKRLDWIVSKSFNVPLFSKS